MQHSLISPTLGMNWHRRRCADLAGLDREHTMMTFDALSLLKICFVRPCQESKWLDAQGTANDLLHDLVGAGVNALHTSIQVGTGDRVL